MKNEAEKTKWCTLITNLIITTSLLMGQLSFADDAETNKRRLREALKNKPRFMRARFGLESTDDIVDQIILNLGVDDTGTKERLSGGALILAATQLLRKNPAWKDAKRKYILASTASAVGAPLLAMGEYEYRTEGEKHPNWVADTALLGMMLIINSKYWGAKGKKMRVSSVASGVGTASLIGYYLFFARSVQDQAVYELQGELNFQEKYTDQKLEEASKLTWVDMVANFLGPEKGKEFRDDHDRYGAEFLAQKYFYLTTEEELDEFFAAGDKLIEDTAKELFRKAGIDPLDAQKSKRLQSLREKTDAAFKAEQQKLAEEERALLEEQKDPQSSTAVEVD